MTKALFLNQHASPCSEKRCDSLRALIAQAKSFGDPTEFPASVPLTALSLEPGIVYLRITKDSDSKQMVERCRARWSEAAIMAILCYPSDQVSTQLQNVLSAADEFLFCSAIERELILRSERLLLRRQAKVEFRSRPFKEISANLPLVGQSPAFLAVINKTAALARSDATVLVSGETGSGKELVARAIHYQGARRSKPFIPVNCGALPDHLFENELFGHNKGAFTDASSAEQGLIAEAEGGTLFLDEVDTLSPSGQVKLLRFLQNGEYRPIGSSRFAIGDVRVVAATNADLFERVKSKVFREDLYYRLNSLSLSIPPLRERVEDVAPLVTHFLERYAMEHRQKVTNISRAALRKLMSYSWPGNIRELESVMTRVLVFTTSEILQPDDIDLPSSDRAESTRAQSLQEAKTSTITIFERSYLAKLLALHQGNITHAAQAAGKERRTFQRLLRKHNLDRHAFRF
jgi:DNA-binding NtrC family response regulator